MIGFLYPDICNQQGDQGYRDWLEINGIKTATLTENVNSQLKGLVIGDVSERGAKILQQRLDNHWILGQIEKGLTVLAIGRAANVVAEVCGVEPALGTYKSQFVEVSFHQNSLYGYVNGLCDLDKAVTETKIGKGRFIQCSLLGPVCVVNPWFESFCFGIETSDRTDLVRHYEKLSRN